MHDDIEDARGLLDSADQETNAEVKANRIEEAIVLLRSCPTDDLSPFERKYIANLLNAHTRRLLTQLPSFAPAFATGQNLWWRYMKLLLELKVEVNVVLATDPTLKDNYKQFIRLWGQEALDALRAV